MSNSACNCGDPACTFYARVEAGARSESDTRIATLLDTFWSRRRDAKKAAEEEAAATDDGEARR
jgi:hypothetical protein